MRRRLAALRWQLTLSHLAATAVTLVSMIAAIVLLSSTWIAFQNSPGREPAQDARIIARAVANLVVGGDTAELSGVLRAIQANDLRVQVGPGPMAPEAAYRFEQFNTSLRNLAYVVVLAPDGRFLASSVPDDAAFSPPEREEWAALARVALAEEHGLDNLVTLRTSDGGAPGAGGRPVALGAAPIVGPSGGPAGVVIVAKSSLPPPNRVGNALRGLFFFLAATTGVLAGSFVFALASASLVAYLLSRRLVGRLERLGAAGEALAAGDLARRVDEGPGDEVGQLARRFNRMADRLAATMSELERERRQAQEALQAKRELVANVSHELRTPVASIQAHTES